jgi:hypothetical protein
LRFKRGNRMAEITIGDVRLVADGNKLTIARRGQRDLTLSLDAEGLEELIDFITSLAGDESNQRQNFRVPVHESSGLSVQIRKDKKLLSVIAKNISVGGVFVELRPDAWIDLAQEDELEVLLEFEGITQSYRGVVKRRADNGYGLLFPDSMKGNEVDPPEELRQMVMELQRRWIARRAKPVR